MSAYTGPYYYLMNVVTISNLFRNFRVGGSIDDSIIKTAVPILLSLFCYCLIEKFCDKIEL